jgi:hypothetical protein
VEYVESNKNPLILFEGTKTGSTQPRYRQQMPQDRITKRNKTNKGQHGREDKRKMKRKENTWTIPM